MVLEAINGNSVGFKQVARPNLKSSQNFTSKPEEVDEEKSNASKCMIGATALAAVIALGIAGYKGKLGKTVQEFLGGAEKAVEKETSKAGNETPKIKPDAVPTATENDAQKIAKKKIVDGKGYTGVKNTSKAEITYEDGYIKTARLSDGTVKVYNRGVNGFVESVHITKPNDYTLDIKKKEDGTILKSKRITSDSPSFNLASGRHVDGAIWYETTITPDGNIKKVKLEQYNLSSKNYKKGKEIPLRREIDLVTGKSKTFRRVSEYFLDPQSKGHKVIDGKKFSVSYDKKGKIDFAHHTLYNPETKTITRECYKMQDGKLVPCRTDQIDSKTGIMLSRFEDGHVLLDLNNNISKNYRFSDGNLVEFDVEKIKQIITAKGLKFDI